ncbi:MAG: hypothetical protein HQ478_05375 [Chloroflexi bacterium]|nr:hypothetical protein [Chloroflexota bacterium]
MSRGQKEWSAGVDLKSGVANGDATLAHPMSVSARGSIVTLFAVLALVACGGGDSEEPVGGITPTPELSELFSPLMVDGEPEDDFVAPTASPLPARLAPTIEPVGGLFSINELICLQTELGGNVEAITKAIEGTEVLSLLALRSLLVCTGSTSLEQGDAPDFTVEQIDCLINNGSLEMLQNLSMEESEELIDTFVECGIFVADPRVAEPVITVDAPPTAEKPVGGLPPFFAHSDLDCVAERAGQFTSDLSRKATDLRSLNYQVGIATYCLENSAKSVPNYLALTVVAGVTVCQNAHLAVQALIDKKVDHPLLFTLSISFLNSGCTFDELRVLTFTG